MSCGAKEEAGHTRQMNESYRLIAYCMSYQGLSTFQLYSISNPTMEEIGTTNPPQVYYNYLHAT